MNVPTSQKNMSTVGYLAISESPEHGFIGGLLIVSQLGRPLEFHCSTPVRPTPAQEILYGPTLRPFLCGELIAGSLLAAVKIRPRVLLIEHESAEPPNAGCPVGLVTQSPDPAAPGVEQGFPVGDLRVRLTRDPGAEPGIAQQALLALSERIPLVEPFERVHEAIREAQRIGKQEDSVEQAA